MKDKFNKFLEVEDRVFRAPYNFLNETEYIYCYICREPLSAKEKASPDFKINEYCPYCIKK